MKFKVTFVDVIEAENIDEAYDNIRKMCRDIGEDNDVTAFKFKRVTHEALTESVLEDMSIEFLEDGE